MSDANAPETSPDDSAFTPDDDAGHAAVVEQFEEDRAERQRELKQHLSVKERLEQKAAEQTHTVDVLGLEVEFTRLPSDDELELMAIGQRFQSLEDDDVANLKDNLTEMRDEVARIIAENAVDRDLRDAAWWTETLSLVDLVMTGVALAEQNDAVDADEVDEFRNE